jgi:hypothetical protein
MKMWFPNGWQWLVIWVGFILAFGFEEFDPSQLEANEFAIALVIATVLGVWMIEGRRRGQRDKRD